MTPSIDTVTERGASEVRAQHDRWLAARARLMNGKPEPVVETLPPPVETKPTALSHMKALLARVSKPPQKFEPIKVYIHPGVDDPSFPAWKRIALEVCAKHEIKLSEMKSPQRNMSLVLARHEAFYRCKTETEMSLPQIGRRFGRDHTTVLHGVRKHAARNGLPDPFPRHPRVMKADAPRVRSPKGRFATPDVEAWDAMGAANG